MPIHFVASLVACLILVGMAYGIKPPALEPKNQFSKIFYDAKGRVLRITLSDDEKYRLWTPLAKIAPSVIEATILQEDQYFYYHPGINPIALLRAAYKTYWIRDRRMGGSTLSMQLARLRFGFSSRDMLGKLKQMTYALWLELHYNKAALLEAYLNLAPYGGNIEGIGAATWVYFGKPPHQLSLKEALSLAIIPQNPVTRKLKTATTFKAQHLFRKWCQTYPRACQNELNPEFELLHLKPHPFLAPHFIHFALKTADLKQENHTTLDLDLQKHIEVNVKNYLEHHRQQGLQNTAVLLLDHRSMTVKAWVGSADFFNRTIQGEVDGILAKRSPGSTLKPFVYALAFDQGLVHSSSLLKDTPYAHASYAPQNFDRDFLGPVSAADALKLSRNVPAVWLANQLQPDLYDFLKHARIRLQHKTHYGLALALGGVEISMFDLARLYGTLMNQGILKSIEWREGKNGQRGISHISAEAAFITLDILSNQKFKFPIYWKTGTSFGFKDAWTIGFFGPYLLAVWFGDFEGNSHPNFVGSLSALPFFLNLAESLGARSDFVSRPLDAPAGVKQVEVCALSGQLPHPFCPNQKKIWFIPGKSPIKPCNMHRALQLDAHTKLRVCRGFKGKTITQVYEFWPSDLLEVFETAGIKREAPPPFHAPCFGQLGFPPMIHSPQSNTIYPIRLSSQNINRIPLKAYTDADVHFVYWFVNKIFVGQARSHEILFWKAKAGKHQLTVVDDQGRSTGMELVVQTVP